MGYEISTADWNKAHLRMVFGANKEKLVADYIPDLIELLDNVIREVVEIKENDKEFMFQKEMENVSRHLRAISIEDIQDELVLKLSVFEEEDPVHEYYMELYKSIISLVKGEMISIPHIEFLIDSAESEKDIYSATALSGLHLGTGRGYPENTQLTLRGTIDLLFTIRAYRLLVEKLNSDTLSHWKILHVPSSMVVPLLNIIEYTIVNALKGEMLIDEEIEEAIIEMRIKLNFLELITTSKTTSKITAF